MYFVVSIVQRVNEIVSEAVCVCYNNLRSTTNLGDLHLHSFLRLLFVRIVFPARTQNNIRDLIEQPIESVNDLFICSLYLGGENKRYVEYVATTSSIFLATFETNSGCLCLMTSFLCSIPLLGWIREDTVILS